MKKLVLVIASIGMFASSAFAATSISANNLGPTSPESFLILNSAGVRVAAGTGSIALGTFTGDVNVGASSIAQVLTNFVQFGDSAVFGGVGPGDGLDGLYSRSIDGTVTGALAGQPMYTVMGNGATLESSSDFLVFRSDTNFVEDPNPNPNVRVGADFGELVIGETGTRADLEPFSNYYQMIPEPSTVLLTSLGAGFLLFRRRR